MTPSDLSTESGEAQRARRRWDLSLAHQVLGVELHQQGMDAQLLHPRRSAFDAIGIPVPERGAEVGVRRLLRSGRWIKQVARQVGGAVLPQADAGEAAGGGLEVVRQPAFHGPHLGHHHRADLRALLAEQGALGQQQTKKAAVLG